MSENERKLTIDRFSEMREREKKERESLFLAPLFTANIQQLNSNYCGSYSKCSIIYI